MSSIEKRRDSPTWWRSLEQLTGGPLAGEPRLRAFLEGEFPGKTFPGKTFPDGAFPGEADFAATYGDGISRRRWLQVMGASLALAAAGGCRWEKQEILPFAQRPDGRTPGRFQRYATAMPLGDSCIALEITTVDGRPIKIDGNPRHPQSLGASGVLAQAALLELYDPDRSHMVSRQTGQ